MSATRSVTSTATRSRRCSPYPTPAPGSAVVTRAACAHHPNRRARLGTHRPARRRCAPRQRPDSDRRDRQRPTRVAQRAPRPARRAAVPDPARPAAEPLHGRRDRRKTRHCRSRQTARRCRPSASPRTRCAIRTQCCCARKGWTSRRSRCGSVTREPSHIYEHADPALKEQAIARTAPLGAKPGRYQPSDALLAFLEAL